MKYTAPHILSFLLVTLSFSLSAQQSTNFSKPKLSLEGTILLIQYDILNSSNTDLFEIGLEVFDSVGRKVEPRSVSGDIGGNVKGGNGKKIKWDLSADQVSFDRVLNIEIVGRDILGTRENGDGGEQITRMGAIGRSVVFPGWGLSKVNPGDPHWIKGIAAYGSLSGSLILNQRSLVNYQNYLDSGDPDEREAYFNKSVNQEQVSTILMVTAAGIWVADIVWTIAGTGKLSQRNSAMQRKGISLGTGYESVGNTPLLAIRYTF